MAQWVGLMFDIAAGGVLLFCVCTCCKCVYYIFIFVGSSCHHERLHIFTWWNTKEVKERFTELQKAQRHSRQSKMSSPSMLVISHYVAWGTEEIPELKILIPCGSQDLLLLSICSNWSKKWRRVSSQDITCYGVPALSMACISKL